MSERTRDQATERAVERLWLAIDDRRDELFATVADLVRFPSLLGEEAPIQGYVADHLRRSGLATESRDLDAAITEMPNAGKSGVPFPGRPNVYGTLGGAGAGRSLILNGHVDVVSAEPLAAWSHDPWGAEIVGDRMYGRGAFDMKSGVAVNLLLPRLLHDLSIRLQGDLVIHSVIEEECTGNGALTASQEHRADAAVVTEPIGLRFNHAHPGVLWFRVAVAGKAAHAMDAQLGVNAIVKMVPIIEALRALDDELNQTIHPLWAEAGIEHPINLNLGVIQGGDWPSTVPGACELHGRVSFFPGQSVAETRVAIETAVQTAAAQDEWLRDHPPTVSYDGFSSDGSIVDLDEPSVQTLGHWHERVTGEPMPARVSTGIDDMRYYNFVGIPAGCYGASGDNAHGADEWLDLTSMAPVAKIVGAMMLDWCGVAD